MTPWPRHVVHGVENEKKPWLSSMTPRPPHVGHTRGVVPGLAPVPWHVGAGGLGRELERGGHAVDGVDERQVQLGLEVLAPPRPDPAPGGAGARRGAAAEQVAEEVAEAVAGS